MNIYVSNLNTQTTKAQLKDLFTPFGEVDSCEVVEDVFTGKSRGFGYVEIKDDALAQKAISELNLTDFNNSTISVEEAQPKQIHKGSYKVGSGAVNVYRFRKS